MAPGEAGAAQAGGPPIRRVTVTAYAVPTEKPESDGTLAWHETLLVLAGVEAGGCTGLGYTYADTATACLIRDRLGPLLAGADVFATRAAWERMAVALRNLGQSGIGALALSALDTALWDAKARCLGLSLAALLGPARGAIPVYGSGGFTSYDLSELRHQLEDWVARGFIAVKLKVGRNPEEDVRRVAAAREAVGAGTGLFVDANGAYPRKQALAFARRFAGFDVRWFEEPVSSEDLAGLRLLRDHGPPGMVIAAGEYAFRLDDFRRLAEAQAVDVMQADATRCGGVTGFLAAAALCEAFHLPLSTHCAPALHLPLACAAPAAIHLEYFHDHARIERMLFDGVPEPAAGRLAPDFARPGLGLTLKERDAECFLR